MKKNAKCFVFDHGLYIEITYEELLHRIKTIDGYKKRHFWPINGMLMELTDYDYKSFRKDARRNQKIKKDKKDWQIISLNELDSLDNPAEEKVADNDIRVEDVVVEIISRETLLKCLKELSDNEYELIRNVYFSGKTEREMAEILDVSPSTVHYRLVKILDKLKKYL